MTTLLHLCFLEKDHLVLRKTDEWAESQGLGRKIPPRQTEEKCQGSRQIVEKLGLRIWEPGFHFRLGHRLDMPEVCRQTYGAASLREKDTLFSPFVIPARRNACMMAGARAATLDL